MAPRLAVAGLMGMCMVMATPSAPAPVAEAPTPANLEPLRVDLPPIDPQRIKTGFYNPFKQYEGGAIPDWVRLPASIQRPSGLSPRLAPCCFKFCCCC